MSVERKYQMTRGGPGLWYLPSNDGEIMWRLSAYEEDGSAVTGSWPNETPIYGRFWAAEWKPMSKLGIEHYEWNEHEIMLPTRKAAIESALTADIKIASR